MVEWPQFSCLAQAILHNSTRMPFLKRLIWFISLALLLLSCRQQPAAVLPAAPGADGAPPQSAGEPGMGEGALSVTTAVPAQATNTAVPSPAPSRTARPSTTPSPSPAPAERAVDTPTPVPTPTADPYAAYTIEALAARSYGGGGLEIVERLELNDSFSRYLITYPSDGLTIYGFMNVPHDGSKFPVAIVLHGYVDPAGYETLAYTTRYADMLAEAGYFAIHPNLRGFPPSDEGQDAYRTGLAADVLNLIAIIREQSSDPEGPLRRADPEAIHLWGHSMGGGVALRVATVLNEPYLRAAVLYGAMSGDEQQNYEKILEWSGGNSGAFELAAPPPALAGDFAACAPGTDHDASQHSPRGRG